MSDVHLLAIGRARPARRYTQADLYAHRPWPETPLLRRLFLESPIESRGLFVPPEWYGTARTLTDTNAAWREGAMALGAAALQDALAGSGTAAADVDLLAVTTVTGYATPGLDLLLARQEGLRPDIARVHFNNIGCHAAVPLLRVAADHVRARPGTRAVALAVEVCSACFSDATPALTGGALSGVGPGPAAAVLSTEGDGPRVVEFGARYDYEHMEALGFGLTMAGFRIVLDPSIPHVIGRSIGEAVDDLLARAAVDRSEVVAWCLHPGGSRILDEAQRAMGLSDAEMAPSRHVLRTSGNMSSPSVLFVLAEALRARGDTRGGYAVLAAFGPGLGIEVALLAL